MGAMAEVGHGAAVPQEEAVVETWVVATGVATG